jgi:hypothetical protein
MKRIILALVLALCVLAPLIGQSQIRLLGSPDYQTTEAINDSLDAAEVAHDYMKRAAFPDSFKRAWNDSIIAAELRRNQAIKDSLALAVLKTAVDDSVDAALARADSTKIGDGKLAISDIAALNDRLGGGLSAFADSLKNPHVEATLDTLKIGSDLTKIYRSATKTITFADTTKFTYISDDTGAGSIPKGSFTVRHPTTGVFTTRVISGTADEVKVLNGNGAVGNPTIGLEDNVKIDSLEVATYLKYGTTSGFLSATSGVVSLVDTPMLKAAFDDSLANPHSAVDLTVKSVTVDPFLWEVKNVHMHSVNDDSNTVTNYMDTTITNTDSWFYKRALGNGSDSWKNTIVLATQVPTSVTPDSLIFRMRSNAADSAEVCIIVKDHLGNTLLNTGFIKVTAVNTWQYKNFGSITAMAENKTIAVEAILRTKYDAFVDISSIYFK